MGSKRRGPRLAWIGLVGAWQEDDDLQNPSRWQWRDLEEALDMLPTRSDDNAREPSVVRDVDGTQDLQAAAPGAEALAPGIEALADPRKIRTRLDSHPYLSDIDHNRSLSRAIAVIRRCEHGFTT